MATRYNYAWDDRKAPAPKFRDVCLHNAKEAAERALVEPRGFFRSYLERQAHAWMRRAGWRVDR